MSLPRRRFHPFVPLAILLAAGIAMVAQPSTSHAKATGRIVNGSSVDATTYASRWSSIVALVNRAERDPRKGQFCGGTLVSDTLVVTAAHCVVDNSKLLALQGPGRDQIFNNTRTRDPRTMQVLVGQRTLSVSTGERLDVSQILIHPRYDAETGQFDVALMRIAKAPSAALGIVPVAPVADGEDAIWGNGAGIAATELNGPWVAGWGYRSDPYDDFEGFTSNASKPLHRPTKLTKRSATARSGGVANGLEATPLSIQSDAACDSGGVGQGQGYGRVFDPATMICAGTLDTSDLNDENATSNGVDSCYGDSGGPVLASTGTALRLVGVVSFGAACADRKTYGVYTRVASMRTFLATSPTEPVRLVKRPVLSGRARVGRVLRCAPGKWSGAGKVTYKYRWIREGNDETASDSAWWVSEELWERIPGSATTRMYRVRKSDRGMKVGCLVIASNGTTTAAENSFLKKVPGTLPVDPEEEQDDDDEEDSFESLFG